MARCRKDGGTTQLAENISYHDLRRENGRVGGSLQHAPWATEDRAGAGRYATPETAL